MPGENSLDFCTSDHVGNLNCNPFFSLTVHPRIDYLYPDNGEPGDLITIYGWGFAWFDRDTPWEDYITINNTVLENIYIMDITPTTISFIVPSGITCSGSQKKSVNVTVNEVSNITPRDLMVNSPLPSISITSPVENANVCPTFTVTGNFTDNSGCGIEYIKVNDEQASIVGNTFSANVTASSTGNMTITVEIKDKAGGVATVSRNVNVISPSISSISPLYGPPGTTVTINGNCFSPTKSDYKITLTGYTKVPGNNRAITRCNYDTSPPCFTSFLVVTSASANSMSFQVPQDIVGETNSVSINIKGFSAGSINFFVDPLMEGVDKYCPTNFAIFKTGTGVVYGSRVQAKTVLGQWVDTSYGFLDNDPNKGLCDRCTCVCTVLCNDPKLPVPKLTFGWCVATAGENVPLRIVNPSLRPDGSLSVSNVIYYNTFPVSGTDGCP